MRKLMLRFSQYAPAALVVVAAALLASPAHAQRGCSEDPLITGRTCTEIECIGLQANVNNVCKNPPPVSCNSLAGCNVLRRERQHWLDCYTARNIINARCWSGGDLGHQQAAAQAIQNVGTCDARIALPDPVGCGDPCP
jgi:hypothetical protein